MDRDKVNILNRLKRDVEKEEFKERQSEEKKDLQICCECGDSVCWGSGKYVNRVPVFDYYETRVEQNRPYPLGTYVCDECTIKFDKEREDDEKFLQQKTAIVYSSHGQIIINYNTGDVINIQGDEKGELKNIVRFNMEEYKIYHGQIDDSYDILNLGYWDNKGVYEEPCQDWRDNREERLAEDAEHDKRVIKLDLLYRCGGNYKTPFEILVKVSEYPDVLKLKVDDQIEMGQYGTLTQGKFFNSEIHPHTYDGVYDHNLLEVEEITEEESK